VSIDRDLLAVHALGATRGGEASWIERTADCDDQAVLARRRRLVATLDWLLANDPPAPRSHVWARIAEALD
jgi:hypothetical protein